MKTYTFRPTYQQGATWMPSTGDESIPEVKVDARTGDITCAKCHGVLFLSSTKRLYHVDNESTFCLGSVEEAQEMAK
jgi:hypothetical protein